MTLHSLCSLAYGLLAAACLCYVSLVGAARRLPVWRPALQPGLRPRPDVGQRVRRPVRRLLLLHAGRLHIQRPGQLLVSHAVGKGPARASVVPRRVLSIWQADHTLHDAQVNTLCFPAVDRQLPCGLRACHLLTGRYCTLQGTFTPTTGGTSSAASASLLDTHV